jgi:hypothetical protein
MPSRKTQKELEDKRSQRFKYVNSPEVQEKLHEIVFMPSTLETIDYALYDFVNEKLNLFTTTNEGFKKVPIIWASAERAFQLKMNKEIRDSEESLILPLISIERKTVTKDPNKRGLPWANVFPINDEKGGTITVARRINQKKTAEFQNAQANRRWGPDEIRGKYNGSHSRNMSTAKVVYETITIPLPTWVTVTYQINLRTEYQQQMNQLVQPWITLAGNSSMIPRIERDNHKFEVFINANYVNNSNTSNLDLDQRNYETVINVDVLGYLIGEGENQENPKIVKRENAVEFKFTRERVIFGDIPENVDDRGFYRE